MTLPVFETSRLMLHSDMDVRHFSVGTDITILHQCWKSQGEDLRKALRG